MPDTEVYTTQIDITHSMAAHCESGSAVMLLKHAGIDISEPLVFGISGAMLFGYLNSPMSEFPSIVVRNQPKKIYDALRKYLHIEFKHAKFRDPFEAERALDEVLARGLPAAIQTDFFYMNYIPPHARTHFNGHFVVIIGSDGESYTVSDSYAPFPARESKQAIREARFAKGSFAPKGLMIWNPEVRGNMDLRKGIRKGIGRTALIMRGTPLPFLGVKGIRRFADELQHKWEGYAVDEDDLSHQIMMINVHLEDRGTGGGGFRFMYAAFLQEAAEITGVEEFIPLSREMMDNGDAWRLVSLQAARIGRNHDFGHAKMAELADMIRALADTEDDLFRRLAELAKRL